MNKKGQTGGLITGLVFGVATLVVAIIIAFVIVVTLTGAGLLDDSGRTSATYTNLTEGWINDSGYILDNFDAETTKGISIIQVGGNATVAVILSGNYTLDAATGNVTNASESLYTDINFTYVVTTESNEEFSVDAMSDNFSEGVDEVSKKVPTVLLIAAIILILGVLAILVGVWNRMRLGGGSEL